MAFNLKTFQPVGGNARGGAGGAPTGPGENAGAVWNYGSPDDDLAAIEVAGYFNEVRDMVNEWDALKVVDNAGGFTLKWFATVPKSPLTTDVVLSSLDVNAV